MKYVALLTIVDAELNQKIRPAHLAYVSDLYRQGKVVMAGPFLDGKGGMVMYECDSEEEAQQLAQADPVVAQGARTLELRAWNQLELPVE